MLWRHSEAALKIQARHRGKQDRKRVQELREQKELEEWELGAEHVAAATKIQATHRGKMDRKKTAGMSASVSYSKPSTYVAKAVNLQNIQFPENFKT